MNIFKLLTSIWMALSFSLISLAGYAQVDYPEEPYHPYKKDEPMVFYLAWKSSNAFLTYWIAAQGKITPDTPKEFQNFLKTNENYLQARKASRRHDNSPTEILIHSCGGDEKAAMELGHLFKKHKFTVKIGQTYPFSPELPTSNSIADMGECRGACILAAWSKPFMFYPIYYPLRTSEDQYRLLMAKDDGNGNFYKRPGYLPIHLGPFESPNSAIFSHAKAMGVSSRWLKQLFPVSLQESTKLSYWQALRLGLFQIKNIEDIEPTPEDSQTCPNNP